MTRPWLTLPIALLAAPFLVSSQSQSQNATVAYAPVTGACPPNFQLVRNAGNSTPTLSDAETSYIKSRRSDVLPSAWKSYVANLQAVNSSLPDYVASVLTGTDAPTLGIAISGGGYRSALFGAGVLNSLDGRNSSAVSVGTGGLLQAATYISGASGGSWLITSLAQSDFPTIQDLVVGNADHGWLTSLDVLQPGTATQKTLFVGELFTEIMGKFAAGFVVTFADVWSRALARHFVTGTTADTYFNNTANGAGVTFSGIANTATFSSHKQPFPIVVANLVSDKSNKSNIFAPGDPNPLSNPIFEFNVYEMGSFDPLLASFTPTQYLGTRNTTSCVTNYDQASFVMATSSDLFVEFNTSAAALANSSIGPVLTLLNRTIPEKDVSLDAAYYPNPFFGVAPDTFIASDQEQLTLDDGGDDGENVPLQPFLVKSRNVDVIFASDASNNFQGFANGAALIAAQKRTTFFQSSYTLPPLPQSNKTFISQNLATQPTFFGCNSTKDAGPLIIYVANGAPPRDGSPPATNTSTFQVAYNTSDVERFLDQAFVTATQGANLSGGNKDPQWPACLACAVADRARDRAGVQRSGVCVDCFARYCWNGTEATSSTSGGSGSGGKKNGVLRGASLDKGHIIFGTLVAAGLGYLVV